MARVTTEAIVRVLQSVEGLDTIAAYDLSTDEKLDYISGKGTKAMQESVEFWDATYLQPFRVRCWDSRKRGVGRKSEGDKGFTWVLNGANGQRSERPHVVQPAAAQPAFDAERERARLRDEVEREFMREKVADLETELEELHEELDELVSKGINGPPPPPLKWYETAEGITGVLGRPPGEFLEGLLDKLGVFGATRPSAEALNGARQKAASRGEVSPDELELLRAFRVMREVDPNSAGAATEHILKTYGNVKE